MAETFSDRVDITNASNTVTIELDGETATIRLGTTDAGGQLRIQDAARREVFAFNPLTAHL